MASNNTNNPCPNQNRLMSQIHQALFSYDIQLQRQLGFILCKLDPVGFIKHSAPNRGDSNLNVKYIRPHN